MNNDKNKNNCFIKYKNKHINDRVFLIGNGPSLNETNLDLIKDEYSIAMNRVSLIYPKTEWRPSYYIFCSSNCHHPIWGNEWTKSIRESINGEKTIPFIYRKYEKYIGSNPKIEWIENITEKKPYPNGSIEISCFSENIVKRIDKTGTTMNLALQMANFMGFKEIILLGCDLGWVPDNGKTNSDPNHFCKEYSADIPEHKINKINKQMENVHKLARLKIPKKIKIFNASIRTKLDVYPKINYLDLFKT